MKYIKYLIIALTGIFAAACAEEEPYEVGAIDVTATASQVTSTTATINVDLTKCAGLFSEEAFNVDAYGSRYSQYCYVSLFEYTDWGRTESFVIRPTEFPDVINLMGKVTFKNLQPSTTYTFCVIITSPIGGVAYRRDDFTFTTAPEGDYSALISPYEILVNDNICVLGFDLPVMISNQSIIISKKSDLSYPLYGSGTLDFGDGAAIWETDSYNNSNFSGTYNYAIAFRNLEPNTTYYWKLSGDCKYYVNLNSFKFETDIKSFTTSDNPGEFFDNIIKSLTISAFEIIGYCYISPYIVFESEALRYRGSISMSETADFSKEADLTYLESNKDYYYKLHFSELRWTFNGHEIVMPEFYYQPKHNIIHTPDAGTENSESNPATVSKVINSGVYSNYTFNGVWVNGYIVGYMADNEAPIFTAENAVSTNILIADSPEEKDLSKCVAVQLSAGDIRNALSLKSHPENLGRHISFFGDIAQYYGKPGMKDIRKYKYLD